MTPFLDGVGCFLNGRLIETGRLLGDIPYYLRKSTKLIIALSESSMNSQIKYLVFSDWLTVDRTLFATSQILL